MTHLKKFWWLYTLIAAAIFTVIWRWDWIAAKLNIGGSTERRGVGDDDMINLLNQLKRRGMNSSQITEYLNNNNLGERASRCCRRKKECCWDTFI